MVKTNTDIGPQDNAVAGAEEEKKTELVTAAEVAVPADKTIAGAPDEVIAKTLNVPVILYSNSNP